MLAGVPGGQPLAGQMKKVAGALDPPPPPPVHAVMHPGGAGDGGLKTVTFAVKFVVPEFTRRSEVTVAWSVEEVAPARIASFFCVPAKLQFTWEPPEGSVEGRKPEPLSIKVSEAVPAGALAGLALGVAGASVLASIVYQASPRDPIVIAAVVLSIALVAFAAAYGPARRALRIDPVQSLRHD